MLQGAVLVIPASEALPHHKFKHHCTERDTAFQVSCKPKPLDVRIVVAPSVIVRL